VTDDESTVKLYVTIEACSAKETEALALAVKLRQRGHSAHFVSGAGFSATIRGEATMDFAGQCAAYGLAVELGDLHPNLRVGVKLFLTDSSNERLLDDINRGFLNQRTPPAG
jgi:hypothetical protein